MNSPSTSIFQRYCVERPNVFTAVVSLGVALVVAAAVVSIFAGLGQGVFKGAACAQIVSYTTGSLAVIFASGTAVFIYCVQRSGKKYRLIAVVEAPKQGPTSPAPAAPPAAKASPPPAPAPAAPPAAKASPPPAAAPAPAAPTPTPPPPAAPKAAGAAGPAAAAASTLPTVNTKDDLKVHIQAYVKENEERLVENMSAQMVARALADLDKHLTRDDIRQICPKAAAVEELKKLIDGMTDRLFGACNTVKSDPDTIYRLIHTEFLAKLPVVLSIAGYPIDSLFPAASATSLDVEKLVKAYLDTKPPALVRDLVARERKRLAYELGMNADDPWLQQMISEDDVNLYELMTLGVLVELTWDLRPQDSPVQREAKIERAIRKKLPVTSTSSRAPAPAAAAPAVAAGAGAASGSAAPTVSNADIQTLAAYLQSHHSGHPTSGTPGFRFTSNGQRYVAWYGNTSKDATIQPETYTQNATNAPEKLGLRFENGKLVVTYQHTLQGSSLDPAQAQLISDALKALPPTSAAAAGPAPRVAPPMPAPVAPAAAAPSAAPAAAAVPAPSVAPPAPVAPAAAAPSAAPAPTVAGTATPTVVTPAQVASLVSHLQAHYTVSASHQHPHNTIHTNPLAVFEFTSGGQDYVAWWSTMNQPHVVGIQKKMYCLAHNHTDKLTFTVDQLGNRQPPRCHNTLGHSISVTPAHLQELEQALADAVAAQTTRPLPTAMPAAPAAAPAAAGGVVPQLTLTNLTPTQLADLVRHLQTHYNTHPGQRSAANRFQFTSGGQRYLAWSSYNQMTCVQLEGSCLVGQNYDTFQFWIDARGNVTAINHAGSHPSPVTHAEKVILERALADAVAAQNTRPPPPLVHGAAGLYAAGAAGGAHYGYGGGYGHHGYGGYGPARVLPHQAHQSLTGANKLEAIKKYLSIYYNGAPGREVRHRTVENNRAHFAWWDATKNEIVIEAPANAKLHLPSVEIKVPLDDQGNATSAVLPTTQRLLDLTYEVVKRGNESIVKDSCNYVTTYQLQHPSQTREDAKLKFTSGGKEYQAWWNVREQLFTIQPSAYCNDPQSHTEKLELKRENIRNPEGICNLLYENQPVTLTPAIEQLLRDANHKIKQCHEEKNAKGDFPTAIIDAAGPKTLRPKFTAADERYLNTVLRGNIKKCVHPERMTLPPEDLGFKARVLPKLKLDRAGQLDRVGHRLAPGYPGDPAKARETEEIAWDLVRGGQDAFFSNPSCMVAQGFYTALEGLHAANAEYGPFQIFYKANVHPDELLFIGPGAFATWLAQAKRDYYDRPPGLSGADRPAWIDVNEEAKLEREFYMAVRERLAREGKVGIVYNYKEGYGRSEGFAIAFTMPNTRLVPVGFHLPFQHNPPAALAGRKKGIGPFSSQNQEDVDIFNRITGHNIQKTGPNFFG